MFIPYAYTQVGEKTYRIQLFTGRVDERVRRIYPRWDVSWRTITDDRLITKVLVCAVMDRLRDRRGYEATVG